MAGTAHKPAGNSRAAARGGGDEFTVGELQAALDKVGVAVARSARQRQASLIYLTRSKGRIYLVRKSRSGRITRKAVPAQDA